MISTTQVKQAVPFYWVANIEASLRFYVDGLGFEMTKQWIDAGALRWCWLERDGAALMLQELAKDRAQSGPVHAQRGEGVSLYFICDDALAIYREITARGITTERPFVGNGMWVTELRDPDGYRLAFESVTDAPEGSELSE